MGFIFSMKREGHEEFSERKWDEENFIMENEEKMGIWRLLQKKGEKTRKEFKFCKLWLKRRNE